MNGIPGTIKFRLALPPQWPLPVAMQAVFRESVETFIEKFAALGYSLHHPDDLFPIFRPGIDPEEQLQEKLFDWLQHEEKRLGLSAGWNRALSVEEFDDSILIWQDDDAA